MRVGIQASVSDLARGETRGGLWHPQGQASRRIPEED